MNLDKFVHNEYIGWQKCYCFDKFLSDQEFLDFIASIEKNLNVKLIATQDQTGETLHGFVSMCRFKGSDCSWGNHINKADHTSVIVSVYGQDKQNDEVIKIHSITGEKIISGTKHIFKATPVDKKFENTLDKTHQDHKIKIKG